MWAGTRRARPAETLVGGTGHLGPHAGGSGSRQSGNVYLYSESGERARAQTMTPRRAVERKPEEDTNPARHVAARRVAEPLPAPSPVRDIRRAAPRG